MKSKNIKGTNEVFITVLNTLNKFSSVTGKLGYGISKTKKSIIQEIEPFEEQRKMLIEKYGEKNEEIGNIQIKQDSENFQKFIEELKPLLDIELEIPFWQVTQEQFESNQSLFASEANVDDYDILQELFIEKEE